MKIAIKILVVFLLFSNALFSQQKVCFEVRDGERKKVTDAFVVVDNQKAQYDSLTGYYFFTATWNVASEISIAHYGYEPIKYKGWNWTPNHIYQFYLLRKGENFYVYDEIHTPYISDPRFLFVMVNPSIDSLHLSVEEARKKLLTILKPLNMTIRYQYYKPSANKNPPKNLPKYCCDYYSYAFVICKKDSSAFPPDSCSELATLRQTKFISYVGPLFCKGNNFEGPTTFRKNDLIIYFTKETSDSTAHRILQEAGAKKILKMDGLEERYYMAIFSDSCGLGLNTITESLARNKNVKTVSPELLYFEYPN